MFNIGRCPAVFNIGVDIGRCPAVFNIGWAYMAKRRQETQLGQRNLAGK